MTIMGYGYLAPGKSLKQKKKASTKRRVSAGRTKLL